VKDATQWRTGDATYTVQPQAGPLTSCFFVPQGDILCLKNTINLWGFLLTKNKSMA